MALGLAEKKQNPKVAHAEIKKTSDPPFNSATGHETRHYKGEGEDDSV